MAVQQQKQSAAARHAVESIDMAIKGAQAYEREDLVARLRGAKQILGDSSITVHVVGEFKQGKSSLINALLSAPICPVDDDVATAVLTEVRYAKALTASAVFEPTSGAAGAGWNETIAPSDVAQYASEAGNPGNTRGLRRVTVGLDRPILSNGLVLVDTPGVGGIGSVSNASTISSLPRSHAVLFVSDCSQELTESEVAFLRTVRELCPTVLFVLTKTDLYPHSDRMLERDREHLRRAGIEIESLAVSSEVRSLAASTMSKDLNNESGFPTLIARLNEIVTGGERLALDAAITHVHSAVEQMEVVARARLAALADPRRSAELVAELTRAKERADALRERSSKWQTVLQDGFADISSDTEFDLRQRTRKVVHEAEKSIDEGDPAKNWEEFEAWLRQRLAGEALENYALFVTRAKEVAISVGQHFDMAESQVVRAREVAAPVALLDDLSTDASFAEKKAKGAGMAAFQKSYGGFLMFTMLTTMTGLPVPMGLGLIPGLLLGRMGWKEEQKRALEKRRSEAKAAVRRFVDEFNLHFGKDSRDAVRHVQRELRNAWSQRVAELQRSATEALAAATEAAKATESDTGARSRAETDLQSLAALKARVEDLSAHLERTRASGLAAGTPAPAVAAAPAKAAPAKAAR
ncbi:dynamin family protein [Actinomycetospora straminea]|uniref:Dynamin family protein n=1 Tax=Actinomycetospora straminea TaxID=663607 RepID=A0ABP9EDM2_9PSEU|nr:dynamin family protein [Actinomycetospora straminea]MDD7934474.1 dynamin family protein [Actinomycetospora straminea]